MGQSMFIVWRESVEALLVIGILHAWLRQQPGAGNALRMLWAGVAAGLGLAGALGWGVLQAGDWLAGSGGEWFQCAMLLVASLLILHMVGWMHQHGRTLKTSLQNSAADKLSQGSGFGLLVLAMLAVGREGSETVVFLYGIGNQQQGQELTGFVIGGVLGFVLALLSYAALQAGSRYFSWRRFLPGQRGDVAAARWRPADGRAGSLQRPADGHGCTGSVLYGVRRSALGHLRPAG